MKDQFEIKRVDITADNIKSIEEINSICFHGMEQITMLFSAILHDEENKAAESIVSDVMYEMYPDPILFIAYINKKPVGFQTGYCKIEKEDKIYYGAKKGVLPEHRGKGIGKALLNHMLGYAKSNDYSKYGYHTFPENDPVNLIIGLKNRFKIEDQTINSYPWDRDNKGVYLLLTKELNASV